MTERGFSWGWLAGIAAAAVVIAVALTMAFIDRSAPAKFVGGWVESPDMPVGSGSADIIPTLRPGLRGARVCRVIEWFRPADATVTGSFVDECGTEQKVEHLSTTAPPTMGLKPPRCRDIDVPELRNGEVQYLVGVRFKAEPLDYVIPIKVSAPVLKLNLIGSRKTTCGAP